MDHADGYTFPMVLEMRRMAPGMTNTWYIRGGRVVNTSARFSTRDPKSFFYLLSGEKEQPWCRLDLGYSPAVPGITGGIFEFGFSDSLLQMWAAFLLELEAGKPRIFGCFTPEETRLSHALLTAALESDSKKCVEAVS